jgi:N4-(beta-N-acetylglucosaminyl)-L-asparaginase
MAYSRRQFITAATALAGGVAMEQINGADTGSSAEPAIERPLFVSTWSFGKPTNETALKTILAGGSLLDAVEKGIWVPEADGTLGSVGLGGIPNAGGVVQLDACIMSGPGHKAGSVAALEGFLHPISVARRVMEKTSHVMLVGEGARKFALDEGFQETNLLTEGQRERWLKWKSDQEASKKAVPPKSHDTIALLALGADGNIAGGCSTSGMGYKLPGRVGDSPIIGSGLYVDNEIGAAGATGIGENVMRYCGSFMVVEYMRQGLSPTAACIATIRRIAHADPRGLNLEINFVALDKQGRSGAAGTSQGFCFAVTTTKDSRVLPVEPLRPTSGQAK